MSKLTLFFVFTFIVSNLYSQEKGKPVGGNWSKGTADKFHGDVWVEYFKSDTSNDFISARVHFEPNARSRWHKHIGVQIIFAVEGEGFYLEKGKPLKILRKGDVVVIAPETIHAHGSCDKMFVQSVVMNKSNGPNATTWLGVVGSEELKIRKSK